MTIRTLFDTIPLTDIIDIRSPAILTQTCTAPKRDSRRIGPGDVFFCIRGRHHDGHTDLAAAKENGAVCAILDTPAAIPSADALSLPWILVRDTSAVFLPACLASCNHPERDLHLYAVTGTNGKTSVTYLLEAIFSAYDPTAPCAVIGTVENRIAGMTFQTEHTTPAPEITAELLARARDAGVKTVIMEASSHALEQNRLSGLSFDCGIFTGLSEDHLDYHPTMEDYFGAKRRLFFSCRQALVNLDDAYGRRLFFDSALPTETHAFAVTSAAEFTASHFPLDLMNPPCDFIAANRLAAASCALLAGIPMEVICTAIRSMKPIPGRMECVHSVPFSVYLDYAHTPDALRRVLTGLCRQKTDTLHVLFGCGGDRERQKRPMMGSIAAELADRVILTADNSRTEDVRDILAEILTGIPPEHRHKVTVIPDRRAAILHVLQSAAPGDTVLLAGKGHETYQTDKTGTHPFSEREIINAYFTEFENT